MYVRPLSPTPPALVTYRREEKNEKRLVYAGVVPHFLKFFFLARWEAIVCFRWSPFPLSGHPHFPPKQIPRPMLKQTIQTAAACQPS